MMNAPIILFAFNRLDAIKRTVESLLMNSEAADSDLFVFVDGAREYVATDKEKVDIKKEYFRSRATKELKKKTKFPAYVCYEYKCLLNRQVPVCKER